MTQTCVLHWTSDLPGAHELTTPSKKNMDTQVQTTPALYTSGIREFLSLTAYFWAEQIVVCAWDVHHRWVLRHDLWCGRWSGGGRNQRRRWMSVRKWSCRGAKAFLTWAPWRQIPVFGDWLKLLWWDFCCCCCFLVDYWHRREQKNTSLGVKQYDACCSHVRRT